ncbi:glutamyl-Q tRNA(Asp) synthetase [Candidatus Sodalis pierantonius str. SOPE]|uniref:Glutamyl-Q tRNA(Asp) synthetase n=1 Tax=Candidatus Sodalis pierantonii str. SOPE TaxID=2342 RepID=W0HMC1_9GAMM|nr:tRNA glutamyl-Q(34) synthetase GluQRS [Candidatus Sodalis pierantonius]AHF73345.1 glutamyl-Q tRNA(Asp) synthetase [Candidatus Sodalis pierantonius str. SOPE]
MPTSAPYIGSFAPSPSGALHFGSLVAALDSYLQARACGGQWRVRIEDIDPPREVPGAADTLLPQLNHYGLHWDGPVMYQSQRHEAYLRVLATLRQRGLSYYCDCTRSRIQSLGCHYDGHCRDRRIPAEGAAIRLRQTAPVFHFHDRLRGRIEADPALAREDFIIRRRDGLFAYNLAVVVDDAAMDVTEVVRGADLIAPTVRQLSLYRQLDYKEPDYVHLPLALSPAGLRLLKQNHAPALPMSDPRPLLAQALGLLNQPLPPQWRAMRLESMLNWAVDHWRLDAVPTTPAP